MMGDFAASGYTIALPKESGWKCYLFGSTPNGDGMVYFPREGLVPNWFVRWMMKVCLGCTWEKVS